MLLFVDSASHYSTAQIAQKWSSATAVTVDPTGGRLDTGALDFNAATSSIATRMGIFNSPILTGARILFLGLALKPLTIGSGTRDLGVTECLTHGYPLWAAESGTTILRFTSNLHIWYVTLTSLGAIRIYRLGIGDAGLGVTDLQARLLGSSGNGAITLGRGQYVEVSVATEGRGGTDAENATNVIVRVNGSVVLTCGNTGDVAGETWTSVSLGGPNTQINTAAWFVAETGTFVATDVYVLDGYQTPSLTPDPQQAGQYLTYSTFLGAVKIEACFPVADALNLGGDELQWTPSVGLTHFNLIDSPNADDSTSVSSSTPGQSDLYAYVAPLLMAAFPTTDGVHTDDQLDQPILGAQWCWRQTAGGQTLAPAGLLIRVENAILVGQGVVVNSGAVAYARQMTNQALLGANGVTFAYSPLLVRDVCSLTDVSLADHHTILGSRLVS